MRRLALIAAASIAFIAIPEPISAEEKYEIDWKCMEICMMTGGDRDCCEDKCWKNSGRRRKKRLGNKLRC